MRVISGHQPTYLPWLGLIHKASLCDVYIYMDDVQYLQQDWNNRNRVVTPQGQVLWLTVPVSLKKSASDLLKDILINEEEHLPAHKRWQAKHWETIKMCYAKSQFFQEYKSFFEWLYLDNQWKSLSELNLAILKQIFAWFQINAELVVASSCSFTQKKSDLVLEHALRFQGDVVVTGTHGKDYIQVQDFERKGVRVVFQEYQHPIYQQRTKEFVPYMSFIDLLFNSGSSSREICLSGNISRESL